MILVILGIIVMLIVLVLAVPVRARLRYDCGKLEAWASYGPLRFQLFPRPLETEKQQAKKARQEERRAKKAEKKARKEEKKTARAVKKAEKAADAVPKSPETPTSQEEAKKGKEELEQRKRFPINGPQILYSLEVLPPILGRALRRIRRRIRLEPLQIHLLVAGMDPAETAELYGKLEAALAAGLPVLHRLVRIKEQDIRLFLDFQEEGMDCIADVGIVLRPGSLVGIGLCAGGSLLKWLIGFKKLASTAENGKKKTRGAA